MGEPDEPVVLDRRGPHRSIQGLDRLLADAIAEDERADRADDATDDPADDPPDEP